MPHARLTLFRPRLVAFVVAAAVVLAGCGAPAATPVPSPVITTPPATSAPSPTTIPSDPLPSPSEPTPLPTAARPDLANVRIALEPVASGLAAPLFATHAGDGSGRLFVVEQGGRIRILRNGTLLPAPFLDVSGRISAGGERGLLGLAFAPGYGRDGEDRLYVHYTNRDGATTIAEHRAPAGADVATAGPGRIVLVEPQPYANHNGGWIGFDPTGMLLIALGDGGSGGDPQDRARRLDNRLGKILRIDVLGTSDGYRVPSDNPFVGRDGARPEILHYGLRNPWRASIDPVTGDLWIADVGQNAREEVNVARAGEAGLHFGWRTLEGSRCFQPRDGCDPTGTTLPVAEYPHALGCSITGGYVYRGAAIPGLVDAYLFGDYCSGTIWAIDAGLDAVQAPVTLLETGRSIGSFGEDEAGELYVLDLRGGEVLRLVGG
jgi:glucose/arabinose dehydrogenase